MAASVPEVWRTWLTSQRRLEREVKVKIVRRVIVIDASDIESESRFWAGLLGGVVHRDDAWHSVWLMASGC